MTWDSVQDWLAELKDDAELMRAVEGDVPGSLDEIISEPAWATIFQGYADARFAGNRFGFVRALHDNPDPYWLYNGYLRSGAEHDVELEGDLRSQIAESHEAIEDFTAAGDFMKSWVRDQWLSPFLRRVDEVKEELDAASPLPGCWLDPSLLKELKGTARPDTFAEIEKGGYWWEVFDQWTSNCPEGSGWRDKWEQFKQNPDDAELREELKPLVKSRDAPFNYSVGVLKDQLS